MRRLARGGCMKNRTVRLRLLVITLSIVPPTALRSTTTPIFAVGAK